MPRAARSRPTSDAGAAAGLRGRHHPGHEMVDRIRVRVAERGEFPVEHRRDPRLGLSEDQVVEAVVAVDEGGTQVGGTWSRSQAMSRSISGIACVSLCRYRSDQRFTWRAT